MMDDQTEGSPPRATLRAVMLGISDDRNRTPAGETAPELHNGF